MKFDFDQVVDLIPFESIGPLNFEMKPKQVETLLGRPYYGYLLENYGFLSSNKEKSFATCDNQFVFSRRNGYFGTYRLSNISCTRFNPYSFNEESQIVDCLRIRFEDIMLLEDEDAFTKLIKKYKAVNFEDSWLFEDLGIAFTVFESEGVYTTLSLFDRPSFHKFYITMEALENYSDEDTFDECEY